MSSQLTNKRLGNPAEVEHFLYVLALADDCYYVGRTTNLRIRLWHHFKTKVHRSAWTLLHRPLAVAHVSRIYGTKSELDRIETSCTLRLAKLKGFEKVRGAGYCITTGKIPQNWLDVLVGIPPADESKFRPMKDEQLRALIKNAYFEYVETRRQRSSGEG